MPIVKILAIETGGTWVQKKYKPEGETMYEFIYRFPGPPGAADIKVKANHKKERGYFQVGDEVEYKITRQNGPEHPHDGTVGKPQGDFQGSRPAQPAAQPTAQPSSNGEPSFEDKKAKAIHDSVVFKGAVRMWIAQPNDSLGKIAVRARALYQLCECVDIPQDNEPVLSEEPPF